MKKPNIILTVKRHRVQYGRHAHERFFRDHFFFNCTSAASMHIIISEYIILPITADYIKLNRLRFNRMYWHCFCYRSILWCWETQTISSLSWRYTLLWFRMWWRYFVVRAHLALPRRENITRLLYMVCTICTSFYGRTQWNMFIEIHIKNYKNTENKYMFNHKIEKELLLWFSLIQNRN